MKLKEWLDEWSMSSLKINMQFLEMEWKPNDVDRDAAWEMYIELITRVTTQELIPEDGDEDAALASIHRLFELTRETIKRQGRHCESFARIAVVVLNQKIRPFTSRWHRVSLAGWDSQPGLRAEFRDELAPLQKTLRSYSAMLADLAGVEDITSLEQE